ncbi:ABC transporter permease [Tepidiforma sp.]|jgi:ABC-2 type transport system permease protein|uniref:ABC transporter permease n=1 Tax=Tepidiforma sp. TaxID=2682230 RepID=UPI0026088E7F|nr:ABC transporter permease [Tepidiforma sp.]MCX7618669.1 ABC transporter permease [Tepidiforma sp.]
MNGITATWLLTVRAFRESLKQPANELPNAFIPLFFYVVTVGAIGSVAQNAFGVADYKGFQLPVAVLQGAAGVASGAGLAMTLDIQSGYFEKLALTSTPRLAIVLGRMLADAIKAVILAGAIIVLALLYGSEFKTGIPGMAVLMAATFGFALAYSGIGVAIALKTGSPQAAQAGFIVFFPLLFLAPTFAPIEVFAAWLEAVARVNPVTYILLGMRSLVTEGWDAAALAKGGVAVLAIGAVTLTLTLLALRSRVRQ